MASEQDTLRDILTAQARRFEKQTFLEFDDQRFSFAEVDDRTDRVATGLARLGLRIGDRVALLLSNRPEYVFFLLGVPKIGMIPVPIGQDCPREMIPAAVRACGASAVVAEGGFADLRNNLPSITHWIMVDDDSFAAPPFEGLAGGSVLGFWPDLDPEQPALISRTRGSRGGPKAVALSHRCLVSSALQVLQPFRVDGTDRFFCALPLSTVAAEVLLVLVPWIAGATCILSRGYSEDTPELMERAAASVVAGTPQLFGSIAGSATFARCEMAALRLALCLTGPASEKVFEKFEVRHDALVVEGYGLVEGTCLTCANPYTGVRKRGSVGLPLQGQECRIVDDRGRELPPGKSGEIVVRGPNVMKGYDGDPGATARAIRDGWLHTGDRGHVDSDGYYFLVKQEADPRGVLRT